MTPALDVPLTLPSLPAAPLVSVLTASYNYADYLPRALESVLAQTYARFEVVVCDDGSADASPEIAAEYARRDARVRLLRQANGGVASALNAAFQASRGDVICLLDADDVFAPEKLARIASTMRRRPRAGYLVHALHVIDGGGAITGRLPPAGVPETGWIAEAVRRRGGRWRSMPAAGLVLHRALAERLFPIPEALFRREADGYLNTLAPLLTEVAYLAEPLAGYRIHGANLTATGRLGPAASARRLDALRRQNEGVNRRLAALGVPGTPLALGRNLHFVEHRFMQHLFEGRPRRALLAAYLDLARRLLSDAVYGPPRKVLSLGAYAVALALPAAARAAWLTHALAAPRKLLGRA